MKIVFCGDGGVGKTSYIEKILTGNFQMKYLPTSGVQVYTFNHGEHKYKIWDVAGQEKYSLEYDKIFENADKIVIFYDSTSKRSFTNMKNWKEQFNIDCDIIYVRTKCDIVEQKTAHMKNEIKISTKNEVNLMSIFE